MADPQPSLDSGVAYRTQLADARAVLDLMALPGYVRIEEYHSRLLRQYEALLHNVDLDKDIRQNMAFAVDVAKRFLGIRSHFEQLQRVAEAELKKLERPELSPAEIGSRITSFMR